MRSTISQALDYSSSERFALAYTAQEREWMKLERNPDISYEYIAKDNKVVNVEIQAKLALDLE